MVDSFVPPEVLQPLRGFLAWVFSFLCHQDQDALVRVGGVMLPLCWRCAGLHVGCAAGWFSLLRSAAPAHPPTRVPVSGLLWASFAALFLHWLAGQLSLFSMTPFLRYATGLWAGAGVGYLLAGGLRRPQAASGADLLLTYVLAASAGSLLLLLDRWSIVASAVFVSLVLNVLGALAYLLRVLPPSVTRMMKGAAS